jgi:hypothetical protein
MVEIPATKVIAMSAILRKDGGQALALFAQNWRN